ncbi:unnamed protein product [Paramecium sonneborni]|uniref:Uncharacterized protein n=1 Tax=Paramecium sonneborni TaxID=65129 RepID=A0A8S1RB92_9CILI|nr:unnamed protein product [Paramecium sonneborni]
MGNSCGQTQDTEFEEIEQQQIINLENEIQIINTTIQANNHQLKLKKESPQDGFLISNIEFIMIKPKNVEEGTQIMRDLLQFGNKITIIPKMMEGSPNLSTKSVSKKGILKNKGTYVTKISLHSCKQQKTDKFQRFQKK